jgi:hypothetical protein
MNRLISVRKLAALDLVLHGPRFVLIEFAGAVVLTGGLGMLSLRSGLSGPNHPVVWEIALGAVLASIALNYVPLLIHAVALIRSGTARQAVGVELAQAQSKRQYGIQQFLLVAPFAILVIAVAHATMRRTRAGSR